MSLSALAVDAGVPGAGLAASTGCTASGTIRAGFFHQRIGHSRRNFAFLLERASFKRCDLNDWHSSLTTEDRGKLGCFRVKPSVFLRVLCGDNLYVVSSYPAKK